MRSDSVLWQKKIHPQKTPKATLKHTNAIKTFDYTTIADRLRKVILANDSHQTDVLKPFYGISTFPLTAKKLFNQKVTHLIHLLPRVNIMLVIIWTKPVQLRGTRNKQTLQKPLNVHEIHNYTIYE